MTAKGRSGARSRTRRGKKSGARASARLGPAIAGRVLFWAARFVLSFAAFVLFSLLYLRFLDPITTGLQTQRRVEAWIAGESYRKHYEPEPLSRISSHLSHAVVAAEDARFYEHGGVDWEAIQKARKDNARRRRPRGGSTITQQLAKNLFLTSHSTLWRKAIELPITYLMELMLPKQRILELYVNVIEWGPGVYGAEAAARHHYGIPAAKLGRTQSARLASVIPAPRRRRPDRMNSLSSIVLQRMSQMGW